MFFSHSVVQVEGLSEVTKSYVPLPFQEKNKLDDSDPTLPPFATESTSTTVILIAHLDIKRPLSEPRWVRTGDIQDWLRSMFGRMFWVAGDAAEGWEKKIVVVDPDPVSIILLLLSSLSCLMTLATNYLDCPRRLGSKFSCRSIHRTPALLENTPLGN